MDANFFPDPAGFPFAGPISTPPFRFDVDGTKAETDLWMRVRFGGRAEMSLISGVSGVTANVTIRPPISGSSGLGVLLTPFLTFFLNPQSWPRVTAMHFLVLSWTRSWCVNNANMAMPDRA